MLRPVRPCCHPPPHPTPPCPARPPTVAIRRSSPSPTGTDESWRSYRSNSHSLHGLQLLFLSSRFMAQTSSTPQLGIDSRSWGWHTNQAQSLRVCSLDSRLVTKRILGGSSAYNPGSDPLSDGSTCLRDAAIMQRLGINAIRVYNLDPTVAVCEHLQRSWHLYAP